MYSAFQPLARDLRDVQREHRADAEAALGGRDAIISEVDIRAINEDRVAELFTEHGVVLFRGLSLDDARFCELTSVFCTSFGRIGGTLRAAYNEDGSLFEVTEGNHALKLHSEFAHSPNRPDIVWFWCVRPADRDGETLLLDGTEVPRALSTEARTLLDRCRLRYTHQLPNRLWRSVFPVENPAECEAYLRSYDGVSQVRFDASDTLRYEYVVPAILNARNGDRAAFVNSIQILTATWEGPEEKDRAVVFSSHPNDNPNAFSMSIAFEDGTSLPKALLDEIDQVTETLVFAHRLEAGEVLMLDNSRMQHARRAFLGPRIVRSRFGAARFSARPQ